jgi:hypothetical protein
MLEGRLAYAVQAIVDASLCVRHRESLEDIPSPTSRLAVNTFCYRTAVGITSRVVAPG